MKTIKFRPLRINKKSGKIIVASYLQWRKIKSTDNWEKFNLIVDSEYKGFADDLLVCNHQGENLFWYKHTNPELLPKVIVTIDDIVRVLGVDRSELEGEEWKITEPQGKGFYWSVQGFDCDGVPVFSHYDATCLGKFYEDLTKFEPLTVGMVKLWFGYFLYQLENSQLQEI